MLVVSERASADVQESVLDLAQPGGGLAGNAASGGLQPAFALGAVPLGPLGVLPALFLAHDLGGLLLRRQLEPDAAGRLGAELGALDGGTPRDLASLDVVEHV